MAEYIDRDKVCVTRERNIKHCETCSDRFACRILNLPKADVIEIPDNATNGDMIKAMFPDLEVEIEGNYITCWIDEHRWVGFDLSWWNAPYKKEVKK